MKKRILSLLLVLVMLLSLLPAGVLAAEGDVSVTLSGMHDAQVKSLKLYTYMDGVKGADDLLAAKEAADGAYTIDLAPGAYWVDGYDANNDRNGGVVIDVSSDSSSFKLQRMYQISVNPNSWVKDTDYTLSLRVTDASGAERKAEFGSAINWGKTYTSCLFVVGDTVSVTATPNAETHPNYNPATASKTPTMNDSLSLTCKEFVTVTVTAPEGSTIDAGTLAKYYVFSFLEPFARSVEDGTATFHLDKNTDYFYRVRHPQGATYWNYVRLSADAAYTVTEEDLGLTGDFSKSTIYHFENNVYDRAGIYLNINTKGYKNMAVGETFELNSFRNWFAIESFMNAKVALPEMHYQVIDVNGNASDVVTITPNALNSNVAVMEAKPACDCERYQRIMTNKDFLNKKSCWIFGGDGWAYDIGFGGLDHVLAQDEDVNVFVFNTEVYSNTGGQASKASNIGQVAQFAAAGKELKSKSLAEIAMSYGYIYVAQVAMGANPAQTIKAIKEAEAYPGPSLIIGYAPCEMHSIKKGGMTNCQGEMKRAVDCGYWNLFRYDPSAEKPFALDSKEPAGGYRDFLMNEARYARLTNEFPERAEELFAKSEVNAKARYEHLLKLKQLYDEA